MSEQEKTPKYMAQLLEELGWNQGTRIPLANPDNQYFENLLISRHDEIQSLKEALILQKQKLADLNKYKEHVHTEYQENTRLLFAHKQQLEQNVKLRQLACNEANRLDRDLIDSNKKNKDINSRTDALQNKIAKLLKKADSLKSEVCGERGALQEWRAALERNAGDIAAIEKFTKQDISNAKALETKRQKLKVEHDRMQDRLNQLVSNLSAEERACERISVQVLEGMEQRKQMMSMWAGAVENLRQRDTDIRHVREDYAVLDSEASKAVEQCREQQAFCDQQRGNNAECERDNMTLTQKLSQLRLVLQQLVDNNVTLDSEVKSYQREISNLNNSLEKLRMENRRIMDEQRRKDQAIEIVVSKIRELKEKLTDSLDQTKSSEKRAKELEDMLNEEERYTSQVTASQQRVMHCSFVEQQKLLSIKNEEKLFHMQLKASKAIMNKLDTKQCELERMLQIQKEGLYHICYQVETVGAKVSHMEGAQAERDFSAELVDKEKRLNMVCSRHAARVALLERHSARLLEDMRRLTKDLENTSQLHTKLQSRLKSSLLDVEGGQKELRTRRESWRRARVLMALTRLRVSHATRALDGLRGTAYTLDAQRLQLDAAMSERLVEISARRDIFSVQKRALFEDCGKLRSEIKERENRIEQLKKRYEIFISSLGKDESGQQLSVTFFKIKFAADRAELREVGAALDADIARRERDISALEATRHLVHAAHRHFMRHISPLDKYTPEIEELNNLMTQYYEMRDEVKKVNASVERLSAAVAVLDDKYKILADKSKQLVLRQIEYENELEEYRERLGKQETQLQNARDIARTNSRRAHKLVDGYEQWRNFQLTVWISEYNMSARATLLALHELCRAAPEARARTSALVSIKDLPLLLTKPQREIQPLVQKFLDHGARLSRDSISQYPTESIFSTSSESVRSGLSVTSGYTRRLAGFRKRLAGKVQEGALLTDIKEQAARSSISLRVVSLSMDQGHVSRSIPEIGEKGSKSGWGKE